MKNRYVYPAVFKKKGDGYFVKFPDIQSCVTGAASLEKAVLMAKDVLEDKINTLLDEKADLPKASLPDSLKGDKVMLIVADVDDEVKGADGGKRPGAAGGEVAESPRKGPKGKTGKGAEKGSGGTSEERPEENSPKENLDEEKARGDESGDKKSGGGEAEAMLAAEKDKYLRLLAEYDNFRKRSFTDWENAAADAVARALEEMLNVTDNFKRALSAECSDLNYKKGVEMIYTMFKDSLGKLGIEEIDALGKPFDPNFHNAVTRREDENFGENTVCEVFQPGYTLNGRLIRCAMVAVANP
jgi:molecular chaperone GrpE